MKVVIQRVTSASVTVDENVVGAIDQGLMVLLGIAVGDEDEDFEYVFGKTIGLRIFQDDQGKMNRSVIDVSGAVLVVSQFTLLADTRKGKRPSFNAAAASELATEYCDRFAERVGQLGLHVQSGRFGADMQVALVNDGPVTIVIDSRNR